MDSAAAAMPRVVLLLQVLLQLRDEREFNFYSQESPNFDYDN